jgi:hypothetical protein
MMDLNDDKATAGTAAKMFLACERDHSREAVVQRRTTEGWEAMPDWRFERHVLRMALYLREKASVRPSDRVAIVAPLGVEPLVAEWAALLLGVAVATLGVGDDRHLRTALESFAPRVVFAEDAAVARAISRTRGIQRLVVLRGDAEDESTPTYSEALDLGGSLDTAERAQSIRAQARAIDGSAPALAWLKAINGTATWGFMTQGELASRVRRLLRDTPPRPGLIRHFQNLEPLLPTRLALHACVADGTTRIAFGAPDPESRVRPRAGRTGWFARVAARF